MDGSLNQPCRVKEDGPKGCKLLLQGNKVFYEMGYCKYAANKDRLTPCQQPR